MHCRLLIQLAAVVALVAAAALPQVAHAAAGSNNWAVIISTSRYWHNYRHTANALSMYHILKSNGISDDRIVLMMSDSHACDPRNDRPAQIFNNKDNKINLYGCDAQVDFNAYETDIQAALSTLQGRYDENTPISRQLRSDENSSVLVYITGHGGENFIKFQDQEYLSNEDIAQTIAVMAAQKRFKNLLFVAETCHAQSLCAHVDTPNVVCVASALTEEDTYSHHMNAALGVWAIDMFTFYTLQFFQNTPKAQDVPLQKWVESYDPKVLHSTVNWKGLSEYGADWRIGDFFGNGKGGGWKPVAIQEDLF